MREPLREARLLAMTVFRFSVTSFNFESCLCNLERGSVGACATAGETFEEERDCDWHALAGDDEERCFGVRTRLDMTKMTC